VVMTMIRRHLRSIVAASMLAAAFAVAMIGTATTADDGDGTNWGLATNHAVAVQR
jgi:hypothetical protein